MPLTTARSEQSSINLFTPPNGVLDPYIPSASKPWNARRVAHLYRRLGYGATKEQIDAGLLLTPSELVDQILDNAADIGAPDPPYWANWTSADYDADPNPDIEFVHRDELRRTWLSNMINEGIQAKMVLFWHNHFVTELNDVGCNAYFWSYYSLLHTYAFGNFRTFVREMGKNPAMLVYLNGNISVAGEPNENYARELMELFTLGESNGYTQADIVELARALTGWRANQYECTSAYFDASLHDNTPKTIFGQTANYNFNQAHNLIFSARSAQVSRFIPSKIYKHFVYQNADSQIIDGLATTFVNGGWELLPVLKQLFKSEHFFEDKVMNARLKDPLESMLPIFKMAGASYPETVEDGWLDAFSYWAYLLGQEIFNPPNVAGWPGQRTWINESTLTGRWEYSANTSYLLSQNEILRENLRNLALNLTNSSNNPSVIVTALVDFFIGQSLDPIQLYATIENFKAGIPDNYFQDGSWNLYWDEAPYQIINMLYYLVRLPEFQLS